MTLARYAVVPAALALCCLLAPPGAGAQATQGVTVSPSAVSVTEASGSARTATYAVVLDKQPTGDVTVDVESGDTAAVTVSPASLTFTTTNWDTAQTVTATGVDNDVDDGLQRTVTLTNDPSGADYGSVASATVTATLIDDDTRGITLSEEALRVAETAGLSGGSPTYTVKLESKPTANVTVSPVSTNTNAVTVSPSSLTFTTTNWSTAQTVTLSGVNDANTGNVEADVYHTVSGGDYGKTNAGSVRATLLDDDAATLHVSTESVTVTEASGSGNTATYTVRLSRQPTADVEVRPSSNNRGAAVASGPLTFTPQDWSTPQTVTVTGVDDSTTGDRTTRIVNLHDSYGVKPPDGPPAVAVTVTDDDDAPRFASGTATVTFTKGVPGSRALPLASGGNAPVTYSMTIPNTAPDEFSFKPGTNRLYFATADDTATSTTSLTLTATDADGDTATMTVNATIRAPFGCATSTAVTGMPGSLTDAQEANLARDCEVLLASKEALQGTKTTLNWSKDLALNTWTKMNVNPKPWDSNYNIRNVVIPGSSSAPLLDGTLPGELANLPGLQSLRLNINALSGSLPPEFGGLTKVRYVYLHQNKLSGPIPPEWGGLADLQYLNLYANELTGVIPGSLARLTKMRILSLGASGGGNRLEGRIPTDLVGAMPNLLNLTLNSNRLTGPLPEGLGGATKLRVLRLDGNNLSGGVPADLGSMTAMVQLSLRWNELVGPIPAELGSLPNLQTAGKNYGFVLLDNNRLSGSIPTELGNLADLEILYLHDNRLSGGIPAELGSITDLQRLYLSRNPLGGSIPTELGSLVKMERLHLGSAGLSGPIPPEFGNMVEMDILSLEKNRLSGPLPKEIGNLVKMRSLWLQQNQLSGPLPSEIGNLDGLLVLDLQENQLSGPLPKEIGDMDKVIEIRLGRNRLTGPIPPELGNLPAFQAPRVPANPGPSYSIQLDQNQLTGPIPKELGNLRSARSLHLGWNQLTGSIPAELGNITSLESLGLQGNRLTGSIPASFADPDNLQYLRWFSIHGNSFSAPLTVTHDAPAPLAEDAGPTAVNVAVSVDAGTAWASTWAPAAGSPTSRSAPPTRRR